MRIKCEHCGQLSPNMSELNAELWFDDHCEKFHKSSVELPLPLLREVALGNLTREEAEAKLASEVS